MKMKKLFLLPALALLLAACNNGGGGGGGKADPRGSDYDPEVERDFKIMCYLDYNHYDPDHPYHEAWWNYDIPFTQEEIQLENPTAEQTPDPYYPTFLGWSLYALVDEESYLFDWNTSFGEDDVVGGCVELFGIYVGA